MAQGQLINKWFLVPLSKATIQQAFKNLEMWPDIGKEHKERDYCPA